MENYVLEVKNLSISYRTLKSFSIKQNLLSKKFKRAKTFDAVKNVSFSIKKGEMLGLVGGNGAGKSTMLKAIAGIFSPNEGTIDVHGSSVSLLAVGLGFQKELTGRDNIALTGMLMGFSKNEIVSRMDSIIKFSELKDFIDNPVKTYSSGMISKLSFSIAVELEPDILLVDEVLSVGDARFKRKSFKKMKELIMDENRTVIIVSHNSSSIRELCTKALWLEKGEMKMFGNVNDVMDAYDAYMND